eukprot:13009157-Ditylum_brightwellii.AAC.1
MGSIIPQWHLAFNNTFLTMSSPFTAPPPHWEDLKQNCSAKYYIMEFDYSPFLLSSPTGICLPNKTLSQPPLPLYTPHLIQGRR